MAFYKATGTSSLKNDNDFILKPECRHWRYSLNKEGATEIRVVPAIDPTTGQPEALIDPSRGSDMFQQLTNAIAFVDVVTFLGPGSAHMICPTYEGERQGPVQYFIGTIQSAVKNDPKGCDDKWLSWCGMGPNKKDVMSNPSSVALLQGYLYTHKGAACTDRDGNPGPKSPVVLQLNRSATKELCDKLGKALDPNGQWGSDNNAMGDFVHPQNGRILCFTPYQHVHMTRTQTWYHAEIGSAVIPLTMDDIMSVWKPWDEVINWQPSLTEVGGWLVKAFDASSVVKVFDGHPMYSACITDTVRAMAEREEKQAVGRVQTGYAGYGQPYGGYPPVPQAGYPPAPQPQYAPPVEQPASPYPNPTMQSVPGVTAYQPPVHQQYAPPTQNQPVQPPPPPTYNPPVGIQGDDDTLPFDNHQEQAQPNVTIRRPRR